MCCGYTTQLPEVLETGRALSWRKDGHLRDFYDGEPLTDMARDLMDILDIELRHAEAAAMKARLEKHSGPTR